MESLDIEESVEQRGCSHLRELPMTQKRKSSSTAKSEVLAIDGIFGAPPILPGEDASAYEVLLARVSAGVKPADIIEKIWVRDVVDLTWEIFRLRRIKAELVSQGIPTKLADCLDAFVHEYPQYPPAEEGGTITREYRK